MGTKGPDLVLALPDPSQPRLAAGISWLPPDPSFSSLPFPCNTQAHAQHYQGHQFRAVQPVLGEVLLLKLIADFYEVSYVFFSLPTRAAQQLRREAGAPIPGAPPGPKGELRAEPQTPQRQRPDLVPIPGDISRLCAAGLRDAAFPPLVMQGTLLLQPPSRRDPKRI